MDHELTIQLNDAVFSQLQLDATSQGKSLGELAATAIAKQYAASTDSNSRRGLVKSFFGTFDVGRPIGTDNEAIDADLAREYADTHEKS
jgi:hypothetical protein